MVFLRKISEKFVISCKRDCNFVLTASSVMGEFQRTKVVPEIDAYERVVA